MIKRNGAVSAPSRKAAQYLRRSWRCQRQSQATDATDFWARAGEFGKLAPRPANPLHQPAQGSQLDKSDRKDKPRPGPKKPRKATPKSLENAAHYHLQRFSWSSENLRRVLGRRVERSAEAHDTDRAEGLAAIDDIIARFERAGLLNDAVYGLARATSLNRRGLSARAINAKLREKGLSADVIEPAIAALAKNHAEPEFAAAAAYARRRRLGPYRPPEARFERRERDLGAMARSGFGYDLSLRVIDAEDIDALEAEAVSPNM